MKKLCMDFLLSVYFFFFFVGQKNHFVNIHTASELKSVFEQKKKEKTRSIFTFQFKVVKCFICSNFICTEPEKGSLVNMLSSKDILTK